MIEHTASVPRLFMNHRERVISAIKYKSTDRVPYDFRAEQAALVQLFRAVGHNDLDRLMEELDVDIKWIQAVTPPDKFYGSYYENFWGERYIYRETKWGTVREDIPGALSGVKSFNEIKGFDWPSPDIFDYSDLNGICSKYDQYAILYGMADIWQRPSFYFQPDIPPDNILAFYNALR